MNDLVFVKDGGAVTTTLAIATGTENEHASVIKLVRGYESDLMEFGGVRFETQAFETTGGPQQREIAYLNEQQSTLPAANARSSIVTGKSL